MKVHQHKRINGRDENIITQFKIYLKVFCMSKEYEYIFN